MHRHAATPSEIFAVCRPYGADDATVEEDVANGHVKIWTNADAETRHKIYTAVRKLTSCSVAVTVEPRDESAVDRTFNSASERASTVDSGMLTDAELFEVLQALPDEWHDTRNLDIGKADMDTLEPYMERFGSLRDVLHAVEQSVDGDDELDDAWNLRHVANGADMGAQTVKMDNVSTLFGNDRTDSASTQRDTDDVESVHEAYVEGNIGEHEMEQRLEDVLSEQIDEPIPVPDTA